MFARIQKTYAVGYMVVYLHYNSDQPEIQEDIAFFADFLDAERFLAENGGTRSKNVWRGPNAWKINSYLHADIQTRQIEVK